MINVNTDLLCRLKANDQAAWFELWQVFGPSIERLVGSLASRYFGQETIKDVSQETLARLYREIGKFDPNRGVKFSTWLYAIAKHVVLTELTYRNAKKRNEGHRPASLDALEGFEPADEDAPADVEAGIFRAKVLRAVRLVQDKADFMEFQAYYLKITTGNNGKDISRQLGISEASVSRYLKRTRELLRSEVAVAVAVYSWTEEEEGQTREAGLDRVDDEQFDEALAAVVTAAEADQREYVSLGKTAYAAVGRAKA